MRKIASMKNWYKLILCIQVNDSVVHRKAVPMQPSSIPEIREGADFVPKAFLCNFLISLQEHKQYIALMSVKKSSQYQGFNKRVFVCITARWCLGLQFVLWSSSLSDCTAQILLTLALPFRVSQLYLFWNKPQVHLWGNLTPGTATNKHCG